MAPNATVDVTATLEELHTDGYAVIENLLPSETVVDLRARAEHLLETERHDAFAQGAGASIDADTDHNYLPGIWDTDDREHALWMQQVRAHQHQEFDTPWPVPDDEVCISFVPIPTFFDHGRSQRVFNLINKDFAFAPLLEHPTVLAMMDAELGRDAVLLDVSINHVGAHTDSGGWHVDSPISQVQPPFPDFTLAVQTAWMLDDFTAQNGATLVAKESHRTLHGPPKGRVALDNEVTLEGPAGSLAIWLSQTWHRHGANTTDSPRCGVIVQYGRAWVKPFVDLRSPLTAEQATQLSPRLRYMMGCSANAPVRG